MDSREVKKTASTSGLAIASKNSGHRKIWHYSDDTIGVCETAKKNPGDKWSCTLQLKIYQTNPLKHLITYVLDKNVFELTYYSVTSLKINKTYIFMDDNTYSHGNILNLRSQQIGSLLNSGGNSSVERAIQFNQSCFAVPRGSDYWYGEGFAIDVYQLQNGIVNKLKSVHLSQNHYDFKSSGCESKNTQAKEKNAKLPFNLSNRYQYHYERLTDDSFIIRGREKDATEVILKYNFKNDTYIKLFSTTLVASEVRILNSRQLLCVGIKELKEGAEIYSQIWQFDEEKEAKLILEERIMKQGAKGKLQEPQTLLNMSIDIKCLPANLGFVSQPHSRTIPETDHTSSSPILLHLFGRQTVVTPSLALLPHDDHLVHIKSMMVTNNGIVYSNGGPGYLDNHDTHLYELSLENLIQEQRLAIKALHVVRPMLLKFTKLSEVLIDIINNYVVYPLLQSTAKVLVSRIKVEDHIEKLLMIIGDVQYFTGKCADKMRRLIEKKQASHELLKNLKDIVKKHQPHGLTHSLFKYDGRTEKEKIMCQLFTEIESFDELPFSSHFDQLQDDWDSFKHLPVRSVWQY